MGPSSVVLDMIECCWAAQRLQEACPILEMGLDVGYLRVEDVRQGALAQEDLADHPHALRVFVARPDSSEAHHSGECGFQFWEFFGDALVGRGGGAADGPEDAFVSLHEGDYGLAVVLGDVLGLVAARGARPLRPTANRPGSFLIPLAHHAALNRDGSTLGTREVAGSERSLKIVTEVLWGGRETRAHGWIASSDAV